MAEVSGIKLGDLGVKNGKFSLELNDLNKSVSTSVSNINAMEVEEFNLNNSYDELLEKFSDVNKVYDYFGEKSCFSFLLVNYVLGGKEELLKNYVDAYYQVSSNSKINVDNIENDYKSAFIMGAFTSFLMSGKDGVLTLTLDNVNYEFNSGQISNYLLQAKKSISVGETDVDKLTNILMGNKEYSYVDSSGVSQVIYSFDLRSILNNSDSTIDDLNNNTYDVGRIAALQHYYYENYENLTLSERDNYYKIMNVSSDYFNYDRKFDSMFLDSNAFDAFCNYLNGCPDGSDKFYQYQKMHDLYIDVVSSGELIPDDIFSKLSVFNKEYDKMLNKINHLDIEYGSYSTYGVDQRAIQRVLNSGLNTLEYFRLYATVKKYFPNYTDREVYDFLSGLDGTDGVGLCTYAVLANYVLQLDKKANFDFGYDLYTKNNDGTVSINDSLLLLDLFCFYNQKNPSFIGKDSDGHYLFESNYNCTYAIDGNDYVLNEQALSGFLQQYGYDQDCFEFDNNYMLKWYPSSIMDENLKEDIRNSVIDELSKGNFVHLDYLKNYSDEASLKYYSENGDYHLSYMAPKGSESGHLLTITGINEDGDLIVSSWGGIYNDYAYKILRLDDLTGLFISLYSEENTYNENYIRIISDDFGFDDTAVG